MLFFNSWTEILRVGLSALLVYAFILIAVRVSGKRSTAQMNNFDWIVTAALGAMVGQAVLVRDLVLVEVFVGMGVLLILQFAVTMAASRWGAVADSVSAPPTLLFYRGTFDMEAMEHVRVTKAEVCGAMRKAGFGDLDQVGAVVLESGASFSVLANDGGLGLLEYVERISPSTLSN